MRGLQLSRVNLKIQMFGSAAAGNTYQGVENQTADVRIIQ